eukprot:5122864-Pleurochrysis_carterae.AAC.3
MIVLTYKDYVWAQYCRRLAKDLRNIRFECLRGSQEKCGQGEHKSLAICKRRSLNSANLLPNTITYAACKLKQADFDYLPFSNSTMEERGVSRESRGTTL